jgi:hypothetical protein
MPKLQSGLKFVLTQSKVADGTAHPKMLSINNTDFRLYELLKNDSRSHDRTGEHARNALAA